MWLALRMITMQVSFSIISVLFRAESNETLKITKNSMSTVFDIEKTALAEFRRIVSDVLEKDYEKTDEYLLSWIREKDMDINAANQMFREAKRWRKYHHIDSIINETVTELRSTESPACNLDIIDNEGLRVLTCEMNGIDLRKLVMSGRTENVIRYYTYWMERFQAEARLVNMRTGKNIRPIIISNTQGMKFNHEIMVIARQYYPEPARCMVVINVPTMALPAVELLKSVMSETSRRLLQVFGPDREEWSQFLLSIIPSNQLPKAYGGTK